MNQNITTHPPHQQILPQLADLLDTQSTDPQALTQFHDLMRALAATEPEAIAVEDSGPLTMLTEDPQALATRFAAALDTAAIQARTGVPATGPLGQTSAEGGAADLPGLPLTDADQGLVTLRRWARPTQNHRAIEVARSLGLFVCFNLLMFDPDTTLESVATNLDFIEHAADHPFNFGRVELNARTPLLAFIEVKGK